MEKQFNLQKLAQFHMNFEAKKELKKQFVFFCARAIAGLTQEFRPIACNRPWIHFSKQMMKAEQTKLSGELFQMHQLGEQGVNPLRDFAKMTLSYEEHGKEI